jgi:hypothetical protein
MSTQTIINVSAPAVRNQSNESSWIDETGISCPATRILKTEKFREKSAFKIYTQATKLSRELAAFKMELQSICAKVYEEALAAIKHESKREPKGNFTWYNFDRSIKIEVNINETITFDDIMINAAKERLEEFFNQELSESQSFLRELVNDAFSTSRGKLDVSKVLGLLKHRSKTKAQAFHAALDLIEKSIRRPSSRQYMRVWYRNAANEYMLINLNFSSL